MTVDADTMRALMGFIAAVTPEPEVIATPLAAEIRTAIEDLAVKHINGQVDDGWVAIILTDRRPDLSPWERWAMWTDLCDAYQRWADAENGEVPLGPLENDLQNADYYAQRMRADLDELLDELCEGARPAERDEERYASGEY